MLKQPLTQSLLCLAALLSSEIASAAMFDYNSATLGVAPGSTNNSVAMTVDGINVNITAYTIENNGSGTITGQTLLSGGAGVYVSGTSSNNLGVRSSSTDGTKLDGGSTGSTTDLDEGLLFTFDQIVSLDFINFDSFTSGDDFNLTVDGVSILVDYNADSPATPLVTNDPVQFDYYYFNNITGTEFLIWADGNSDSFRIDQMTVSAVPVPAAVWLFASGLLGLAGFARKKVS